MRIFGRAASTSRDRRWEIARLCETYTSPYNHTIHKPSKLLPLFKQAPANAKKYLATSEEDKAAQREKKRSDAQRRVYFHQEFHPQGPKAREIQSLFETHVLNPPGQEPFNVQ